MLSLLVCCIIEFIWILLLERKCKKLASSYDVVTSQHFTSEVKSDE